MPQIGRVGMEDPIKRAALEGLAEAMKEGRVDPDITPLLDSINLKDGMVTTSSCSGRLQLIRVPAVGDKLGAEVLGKWHEPASPDEVLSCLGRTDRIGHILLMVQPLLLHIRCLDLTVAHAIWMAGQEAGLKFSTFRSIKIGPDGTPERWGVVVELMGTERMDVPLDGLEYEELARSVPIWTRHANGLLKRTKGRMKALMDLIEDERSPLPRT